MVTPRNDDSHPRPCFCIFKFVYITYYLSGLSQESFYNNIFNWFILPVEINKILDRPCTPLLTYMFMHDSVFHMLGKLIYVLWAFGYIFRTLPAIIKSFLYFYMESFAGAFLFVFQQQCNSCS